MAREAHLTACPRTVRSLATGSSRSLNSLNSLNSERSEKVTDSGDVLFTLCIRMALTEALNSLSEFALEASTLWAWTDHLSIIKQLTSVFIQSRQRTRILTVDMSELSGTSQARAQELKECTGVCRGGNRMPHTLHQRTPRQFFLGSTQLRYGSSRRNTACPLLSFGAICGLCRTSCDVVALTILFQIDFKIV